MLSQSHSAQMLGDKAGVQPKATENADTTCAASTVATGVRCVITDLTVHVKAGVISRSLYDSWKGLVCLIVYTDRKWEIEEKKSWQEMVWGFSVVDAHLRLDSIFFLSPIVCQNHFNKSQHAFSMILIPPTDHVVHCTQIISSRSNRAFSFISHS